MIRRSLLLASLALAAPLGAAEAAFAPGSSPGAGTALSPSAATAATATAQALTPGARALVTPAGTSTVAGGAGVMSIPESSGSKESGFTYVIGATALSVFNGSPLSYTPFEVGWRFENGLRIRTAADIFYYEGMDIDAKQPELGQQLYSYDMMDLRTSVLYAVPLPSRVRPVAGMTVEAMGGSRKLAGGVLNPPTQAAWGFLGTGAVLGAEWRAGDALAVELLARYTYTYANVGALTGVGLDTAFLF